MNNIVAYYNNELVFVLQFIIDCSSNVIAVIRTNDGKIKSVAISQLSKVEILGLTTK